MNDFTVCINITSLCNVMCDYCSAYIPYDSNDKNIITLTTIKIIVNLINQYLKDYSIKIVLLGGETLLHPDINSIILSLYEIHNLKNIDLYTNASLLLENMIHNPSHIHYIMSYHIDILLEKNLDLYNTNFFKNILFLK